MDLAVRSANASDSAINVPTNPPAGRRKDLGMAIFSQHMDPLTINSAPAGTMPTFTLKETMGNNVRDTVVMNAANTVATFSPVASALTSNTSYAVTVRTVAKTKAVASIGLTPVALGKAGNFAILAKNVFWQVAGGVGSYGQCNGSL